MDFYLHFVLSLFLVPQEYILGMQVAFRQNEYKVLEAEYNVTWSSIDVHEKTSTILCSIL